MTSTNPPPPTTPDRRIGCLPWAILIALVLIGVAIWQYPAFKARAELGAAYAARIGCSCRYVEERSLASCKTDFEPGMEIVSVDDDPQAKAVTGSVSLLATRTARFAGASGCLLDPVD